MTATNTPEAGTANSVAITTHQRDLTNLGERAKYLPHDDDGCRECVEMNAWIDKTTKTLRRLIHDKSRR